MSALAANEGSWSLRTWIAMVASAVALQAAFVFLVSDRTPVVRQDNRQNLTAGIIADPASNRKLLDALGVGDPSLLALINPQPFTSGRPNFKEPEEPAPWDITEPDRPLAQSPEGLGMVFTSFMHTNAALPLEIQAKPAPSPMVPKKPAPFMAGTSILQLGEGLVDRHLLGPAPVLPSWTNTDLITNTIVQISLNPDGEVFSPRLASGAATSAIQHEADLSALAIARSLRFQARSESATAASNRLSVGSLIFHWLTIAPRPGATPSDQ